MHPSILFSLYVCGVGDIPTDNLSTRQFFKTTICQHDNLQTRHFIKRQFFKTTIFQTTISQFKTTIYQHDNFPTKRQFSNETTIFQLQTTIFQFQMTIFTFSLAKVYKHRCVLYLLFLLSTLIVSNMRHSHGDGYDGLANSDDIFCLMAGTMTGN